MLRFFYVSLRDFFRKAFHFSKASKAILNAFLQQISNTNAGGRHFFCLPLFWNKTLVLLNLFLYILTFSIFQDCPPPKKKKLCVVAGLNCCTMDHEIICCIVSRMPSFTARLKPKHDSKKTPWVVPIGGGGGDYNFIFVFNFFSFSLKKHKGTTNLHSPYFFFELTSPLPKSGPKILAVRNIVGYAPYINKPWKARGQMVSSPNRQIVVDWALFLNSGLGVLFQLAQDWATGLLPVPVKKDLATESLNCRRPTHHQWLWTTFVLILRTKAKQLFYIVKCKAQATP